MFHTIEPCPYLRAVESGYVVDPWTLILSSSDSCVGLPDKTVAVILCGGSLEAQTVKNLPAIWETQVQSLGQENPLEKGMATHSIILAWRTSWTEEPCGL